LQEKRLKVIHIYLVLCLAWQDLIFPLMRLTLWHNDCLSHFHIYNLKQECPKRKKKDQLFSYTILLHELARNLYSLFHKVLYINDLRQSRRPGVCV